MEYLFLSVIALLIPTISGNVEISFMKGAPRLNVSMYCDYYFACHAEGETLQWIVNNNNISDYSGQSVGHVFTGSISTCNYTTTLLSLKPVPPGLSILDSVLIVSCQSSIDFDVSCTNGSVSSMTSSPEKGQNTRAESNITSVNLEHVLNAYLVTMDSSSCTNIFVCGVDNLFILWQSQGNQFGFTAFDNIGVARQIVRDTTAVEQQAILIGNEPYSLVVVMIVIGSTEINVTCGYRDNTASFSSISCLETTGSETSTVGESSTMTSGDNNILPLILGLSITFGVLLVVSIGIIMIITIFSCLYYNTRSKLIQRRFENQIDLDVNEGIPLKKNNNSEIKKPKEMMRDINYNEFFERVKYVFLTRNENTFNAATTILTAPDIEETTNEQLTCIEKGVYIGMIGSDPVCLVNENNSYFVEKLKNVIITYFQNAKFLVLVERCFRFDKKQIKKLKLGDTLISKSIRHATYTDEYQACTILTEPEIRSKFCFYPDRVPGLNVTETRIAKPFVVKIASGVDILGDKDFRSFALSYDGIYGCEETSGELFSHFENGIDMGNNTIKQIEVITIGAVTGYVDEDTHTIKDYDEWQFMASKAAFHYVACKIKQPHSTGNISYEIKDPIPRSTTFGKEFGKEVKYLILTLYGEEFSVATTNISGPDNTNDIIEITETICMGMIGPHKVGVLYLSGKLEYFNDIKSAITDYFPYAKYLVHIGGCVGIDKRRVNLGDVLISTEIHYIYNDGIYTEDIIPMTTEIKNIFGNPQGVDGLNLPGNRNARHLEVSIASGSGTNIKKDQDMKNIAMQRQQNYGFEELGGDLVRLQKAMKNKIHVIVIAGVFTYADSADYDEWDFVASQAAFHYVKMKLNPTEL